MDTKLGGLHYDGTGAFYLVDGKRAYRVLYMHDEYVYDCEEAIAQYVADVGSESIKRAGERFNLRVPLLSEAKIGLNWSELK
jgi:DNA polymerase I-like protein with 3'-5' exonuclease and polymerase domains